MGSKAGHSTGAMLGAGGLGLLGGVLLGEAISDHHHHHSHDVGYSNNVVENTTIIENDYNDFGGNDFGGGGFGDNDWNDDF